MTTAVRERPILFSAPMIRALLEGRKTQARRVVRPTMTSPKVAPLRMEPWLIDGVQQWHETLYLPMWAGFHPDYPGEAKWFTCPYGKAGERQWLHGRTTKRRRTAHLSICLAGRRASRSKSPACV